MTWDIIGYNTGTVEHGVTGPSQTATLLLDAESYINMDRTYFDNSSPYSNEYAGSDLQAKVESFYVDDIADKRGIEPRDLEGGSGLSISDGNGVGKSAPYTGGTVAGSAVIGQYLWPLSLTEASQLKASVRKYGTYWWLRSPGHYDFSVAVVYIYGYAYSDGNAASYSINAARPALYLNLESPIFTSLKNSINAGTLLVGAYDKTLKVTDGAGYTWDIVGVNGDVSRGVAGPEGYATLLLSNSSEKKFGFPNQNYSGTILGRYDTRSKGYSNEYSSSDLKNALESAYGAISGAAVYSGKILARDLAGSEIYNDGNPGEGVAGAAVSGQHLWPLSVSEARTLSNQERLFGGSCWWLRSPGSDDNDVAGVSSDGYVLSNGNVAYYSNDAVRPALYLNLESSIFTSLPADWQQRVGCD
jgi:hypothetical protein